MSREFAPFIILSATGNYIVFHPQPFLIAGGRQSLPSVATSQAGPFEREVTFVFPL